MSMCVCADSLRRWRTVALQCIGVIWFLLYSFPTTTMIPQLRHLIIVRTPWTKTQHGQGQCLRGGGPSLPLPDAQNRLRLPPHLHLIRALPDGNCFYHCVLMAANDGYTRAAWTLTQLKGYAQHPEDTYAEGHHMERVAHALHLTFVVHPVNVDLVDQGILWDKVFVVGDEMQPRLNLVWWFRDLDGTSEDGIHFDLLARRDSLQALPMQVLRARAKAQGFHIQRQTKKVHMCAFLRSEITPTEFESIPTQHGPACDPSSEPTLHVGADAPDVSKHGYTVMQWNVCSVEARKVELAWLLAEHQPTLVFLQETFIADQRPFTIPGYSVISRSCQQGRKGGGIMCLSRDGVIAHSVFSEHHCEAAEMMYVTAHVGGRSRTFGNAYWPPPASSLPEHDEIFRVQMREGISKCSYIFGDFNAPIGSTRYALVDDIIDGDMVMHPLPVPSSLRGDGQSSPDACYMHPANEANAQVVPLPPGTADHVPMLWSLGGCSAAGPKRRQQRKWQMHNISWKPYQGELLQDISLRHSGTRTVSGMYKQFVQSLLRAAAKTIPCVRPRRRDRIWWTPDCQRCKDACDSAHATFQTAPYEQRHAAHIAFQEAQGALRKAIREGRRATWERFCSSLNATHTTSVDPLAGPQNMAHPISPHKLLKAMGPRRVDVRYPALVYRGKLILHGCRRAKLIAQHFRKTTTPSEVHQHIHQNQVRQVRVLLKQASCSSSAMAPWSMRELRHALSRLRTQKAYGADNMPAEFLKALPHSLLPLLLELCRRILREQWIPGMWRKTIAIPLLKPNKAEYAVESYRLVGLQCSMLKLFENLLLFRLRREIPIGHPHQFGFVPGKSATDKLAVLTHTIANHLQSQIPALRGTYVKGKVLLIKIDFDKAFDRLWYPPVLKGMYVNGAHPDMLRFMLDLLGNRWFKVRTPWGASGYHRQRLGVVQGSIMGPSLWVRHLDDLLGRMQTFGEVTLAYADDLSIVIRGYATSSMEQVAEKSLQVLWQWSHEMHQPISPHKSEVMLISRNPKDFVFFPVVCWSHPAALQHANLSVDISHDQMGHLPNGFSWQHGHLLYKMDDKYHKVVSCDGSSRLSKTEWLLSLTNGVHQVTLAPVLRVVQKMSILGVTYEPQLSFGYQSDETTRKCHECQALIKRLQGASWGPDVATLRTLSIAHLQGRMDYALPAWIPFAAPTHALKLHRLEAQTSRIIVGHPSGSDNNVSILEAGLTPLVVRLAVACFRVYMHAHISIPQSASWWTAHGKVHVRTGGWRAIANKFQDKFCWTQTLMDSVQVAPQQMPDPPVPSSWAVHLDSHAGNQMDAAHRKQHFLQTVARTPCDIQVWVDGSFSPADDQCPARAGIAAVVCVGGCRCTYAQSIAAWSSAWSELHAIVLGLQVVLPRVKPGYHIHIYSDSLVCLRLMDAGLGYAPLPDALSRCFSRSSCHIFFFHVPSHVGLPHHDHADQAAQGISQTDMHATTTTPATGLLRKVKMQAALDWYNQMHIDSAQTRTHFPTGSTLQLYLQWRPRDDCVRFRLGFLSGLPRWLLRCIFQLRARASPLFWDFQHRLGSGHMHSQWEYCPLCGHLDSWEHIFFCDMYTQHLAEFDIPLDDTGYGLLHSHPERAIEILILLGRVGPILAANATDIARSVSQKALSYEELPPRLQTHANRAQQWCDWLQLFDSGEGESNLSELRHGISEPSDRTTPHLRAPQEQHPQRRVQQQHQQPQRRQRQRKQQQSQPQGQPQQPQQRRSLGLDTVRGGGPIPDSDKYTQTEKREGNAIPTGRSDIRTRVQLWDRLLLIVIHMLVSRASSIHEYAPQPVWPGTDLSHPCIGTPPASLDVVVIYGCDSSAHATTTCYCGWGRRHNNQRRQEGFQASTTTGQQGCAGAPRYADPSGPGPRDRDQNVAGIDIFGYPIAVRGHQRRDAEVSRTMACKSTSFQQRAWKRPSRWRTINIFHISVLNSSFIACIHSLIPDEGLGGLEIRRRPAEYICHLLDHHSRPTGYWYCSFGPKAQEPHEGTTLGVHAHTFSAVPVGVQLKDMWSKIAVFATSWSEEPPFKIVVPKLTQGPLCYQLRAALNDTPPYPEGMSGAKRMPDRNSTEHNDDMHS